MKSHLVNDLGMSWSSEQPWPTQQALHTAGPSPVDSCTYSFHPPSMGSPRQAESCPWQVAHALGWPRALKTAGAAQPLPLALAAGAILPCPSDSAQGSPILQQHIPPQTRNISRVFLTVMSVLSWVSFSRSLQPETDCVTSGEDFSMNKLIIVLPFALTISASFLPSSCRQCPQPCWAGKGAAPQQKCLFEAFLGYYQELPLCQGAQRSSAAQTQHKDFNDPLRALVLFASDSVSEGIPRKNFSRTQS